MLYITLNIILYIKNSIYRGSIRRSYNALYIKAIYIEALRIGLYTTLYIKNSIYKSSIYIALYKA
jgi:hypothetical protein